MKKICISCGEPIIGYIVKVFDENFNHTGEFECLECWEKEMKKINDKELIQDIEFPDYFPDSDLKYEQKK